MSELAEIHAAVLEASSFDLKLEVVRRVLHDVPEPSVFGIQKIIEDPDA